MKNFTLIEAMIAISILGILTAILIPAMSGKSPVSSYGVNGLTETRCINGYQFIVGANGSAQQILGSNGGGVECQ